MKKCQLIGPATEISADMGVMEGFDIFLQEVCATFVHLHLFHLIKCERTS